MANKPRARGDDQALDQFAFLLAGAAQVKHHTGILIPEILLEFSRHHILTDITPGV